MRLKNTISENVRTAWQAVKLFILDELSLLSCGGLGVLNDLLQKIFKNDLPMGGIHVLLLGDLGQL